MNLLTFPYSRIKAVWQLRMLQIEFLLNHILCFSTIVQSIYLLHLFFMIFPLVKQKGSKWPHTLHKRLSFSGYPHNAHNDCLAVYKVNLLFSCSRSHLRCPNTRSLEVSQLWIVRRATSNQHWIASRREWLKNPFLASCCSAIPWVNVSCSDGLDGELH